MVTIGLTLSACGAATNSASNGPTSSGSPKSSGHGPVNIVFIQKQGDEQYFVDERAGATAMAQKMEAAGGPQINIKFVNVGTDSNAAINAVNTAVADQASAVAIVVPDAKIGPQVANLLTQANIPFVATDDPFNDGSGQQVPWVSIDSLTMGKQIGTAAGNLVKQAGWTVSNTRVLSIKQEDLGVCTDRETGYLQTMQQTAGILPPVIKVGTDNSVPDAQNKVGAVITANPNVTNWVVLGCNEESVSGGLSALRNAGVKPANLIGVGLGAYLACKDWRAGKDTGFKASLNVPGQVDGGSSVKVLVDKVANGIPIPAKTLGTAEIVNASTWKAAGVSCS